MSLAARLGSTFTRSYAQDDFFWAYTSWLRSGPLRPNHDYLLTNFTPLSELAAPLFRWFPASLAPFYVARAMMFLIGALLVWATYRLARALGASTLWALIAANALSWQFHFVKRIGDIRADQVTALFLVLAVLWAMRLNDRHAAFVSGIVFGISVAMSYKIAVAGPMLLAGVILANRTSRFRAAASFIAGSAIAPALYFGWRISVDGWDVFLETLQIIFSGVAHGTSERLPAWSSSLILAITVFAAIATGMVTMMIARGGDEPIRRRRVYAILTLAFLVAFIAANPYIFPYNFVIFMPLLAPLLTGIEPLLQRRTEKFEPLLAGLLLVSAVIGGFFAVWTTYIHDNETQNRVMRWIWQGTKPSETVYDWQGIHIGRRGIFHWWHFSGWQPRYKQGWYSVADEIQKAQVTLIILNYRLLWLTQRDRDFIDEHFVGVDDCLMTPGWSFRPPRLRPRIEFEAFLQDAEYRAQPGAVPGIFIDGQPLRERQRLAAGVHTMTFAEGTRIPSNLALYYTTEERERTLPPCRGGRLIVWYN